jgi:hypothetical protein
MDEASDSECYTPSSQPFTIIHCHQHLNILDGRDAESVRRTIFHIKNFHKYFPIFALHLQFTMLTGLPIFPWNTSMKRNAVSTIRGIKLFACGESAAAIQ